jgi:hypothetical protein
LHGIDLIRPHHHELLLAGDQHHVAADGLAEVHFFEEGSAKLVEVGDLLVVLVGELVDGQEALVGIEAKWRALLLAK